MIRVPRSLACALPRRARARRHRLTARPRPTRPHTHRLAARPSQWAPGPPALPAGAMMAVLSRRSREGRPLRHARQAAGRLQGAAPLASVRRAPHGDQGHVHDRAWARRPTRRALKPLGGRRLLVHAGEEPALRHRQGRDDHPGQRHGTVRDHLCEPGGRSAARARRTSEQARTRVGDGFERGERCSPSPDAGVLRAPTARRVRLEHLVERTDAGVGLRLRQHQRRAQADGVAAGAEHQHALGEHRVDDQVALARWRAPWSRDRAPARCRSSGPCRARRRSADACSCSSRSRAEQVLADRRGVRDQPVLRAA